MYLYIFEDGEMKQSSTGPSDTDYEMIEGGYLTVVQLKLDGGFHEFLGDGSLRKIDTATVESTERGDEYHQ